MEENKRQTAIKVSIKDLTFGKYVQEEGWTPNYVITENNNKISRVNIIATVVAKSSESNYHLLNIDDGTAEITLRSFESGFEVEVGDIINIIGKPRQYGNEKYIMPEIVKKIANPKWVVLRQKELNNIPVKVETEEVVENDSETIIALIKSMETNDGAEVDAIAKKIGPEGEKVISKLLENGEVFETRPGKIKVLD